MKRPDVIYTTEKLVAQYYFIGEFWSMDICHECGLLGTICQCKEAF